MQTNSSGRNPEVKCVVSWSANGMKSPVPVVVGNVRWLSGYRHPRHDLPDVAAALQAAFAAPTGLMAGAESVGDPIAVLPVLFHLRWCHRLHADLSVPLSPDTEVAAVGAPAALGMR